MSVVAHMPVDFKFTFNIFMFFLLIQIPKKKQGNCLRLFALLDVSAEALRITFDKQPNSFKEKINLIVENCTSDTHNKKNMDYFFKRNTCYFHCLRLYYCNAISIF